MKGGVAAEMPEKAEKSEEEEPQLPIQPEDAAGTIPNPTDAAEDAEEDAEEGDGEGEYVARWTAHIRNQQFAAVSIMEDEDTQRDEPAVCVYGAFATEEDCQRYIRTTASAVVHEHDLLCLQMYEWAPINREALAAIVDVGYRDEKLAEVMGGVTKNQLDVDKFRAQCAQEDIEPTVLDFSKPDPSASGGAESKE